MIAPHRLTEDQKQFVERNYERTFHTARRKTERLVRATRLPDDLLYDAAVIGTMCAAQHHLPDRGEEITLTTACAINAVRDSCRVRAKRVLTVTDVADLGVEETTYEEGYDDVDAADLAEWLNRQLTPKQQALLADIRRFGIKQALQMNGVCHLTVRKLLDKVNRLLESQGV